jgi:hypothetical protein
MTQWSQAHNHLLMREPLISEIFVILLMNKTGFDHMTIRHWISLKYL